MGEVFEPNGAIYLIWLAESYLECCGRPQLIEYGPNWDGIYNTGTKEIGPVGKWTSTSTLSVIWGKLVEYGKVPISGAIFFNSSSISWAGDPVWGSGQIWFANGDNRSYCWPYWPDVASSGRVFRGWIEARPKNPNEFRGKNETSVLREIRNARATDQIRPSPARIVLTAKCAATAGAIARATADCSGQCIPVVP